MPNFNSWQNRNIADIKKKYAKKHGDRVNVLASCWANKWYYGCAYPRTIHNIIDHWEPPAPPGFKNVDHEDVVRPEDQPDKYTQVFDELADKTTGKKDDSNLFSRAGTLGLRLRKTLGSEKNKPDVLTAPSRRTGETRNTLRKKHPAKPRDKLGEDIDDLLTMVNSETDKSFRITGTGEKRKNRVVLLQEKAIEFESQNANEPVIQMVSHDVPKSKKRKLNDNSEGGPPSKIQISELEMAKIFVTCHTKEIVRFRKNPTSQKPPDVATYLKSKGISQDTIKAHRRQFIDIVRKVCIEEEAKP